MANVDSRGVFIHFVARILVFRMQPAKQKCIRLVEYRGLEPPDTPLLREMYQTKLNA